MSLEQALQDQTAAINANTIAVNSLIAILNNPPATFVGIDSAKGPDESVVVEKEATGEVTKTTLKKTPKAKVAEAQKVEEKVEAQDKATAVSIEDLSKMFLSAAKVDIAQAKDILASYNVARVSLIPQEDYQEAFNLFSLIVEGGN